jgi:hypothetical protein
MHSRLSAVGIARRLARLIMVFVPLSQTVGCLQRGLQSGGRQVAFGMASVQSGRYAKIGFSAALFSLAAMPL